MALDERNACNVVANPNIRYLVLGRVTQPWAEPADKREREALSKAKELIERLRARTR